MRSTCKSIIALVSLLAFAASSAFATAAQHQHDAPVQSSAAGAAAGAPAADEHHQHDAPSAAALGSVHFETSCPKAQATIDRGVAWLHSFGYETAEATFRQAAKDDPQCAMAEWGIAMSRFHELWENSDLKPGEEAIARAQLLAKTVESREGESSEREAAYIAALANIYDASKPMAARPAAYERAMKQVHERFPQDDEATIFYALAIKAAAPHTDKTFAAEKRCGELLEPVFERRPQHPGVAHYLIHCYDNPVLAERAIPAARRYAAIAPASAHAHHMPSHIFTRVGLWDDSIAANRRSADIAQHDQQTATSHEAFDQHLHALDYMEYAALQRGDVSLARQTLDEMNTVRTSIKLTVTGDYASAAIPARFAVELRHWEDAARLKPGQGYTASLTWMAKGLGAFHLKDAASLAQATAALAKLRDETAAGGDKYWADQIEVNRLEMAALEQQLKADAPAAEKQMRAAAELEDSMDKLPVTPGPIVPARELLAELLAEQGHSAEALAEYQAVLKVAPGRFNALYGAARAANASGQKAVAADLYRQLLKVNGGRQERDEATAAAEFLDKNKSAAK